MKRLVWLALTLAAIRTGQAAWVLQDLTDAKPGLWLLFQTYNTQVLLAQSAFLLAASMLVIFSRALRWMALCLFLTMAAAAFSGHVAASSQSWVQVLVSCLHVWLAQAWLCGVLALVWMSYHRPDVWPDALARFSKWALPGMLMLLFSGLVLATGTVASWAGLLATEYGVLLCLKLLLVIGVLVCAWQLRQWLLFRSATTFAQAISWLRSEAGLALGVLLSASWLAATVPAAHDDIIWPWGFRWAPVLAWRQDPVGTGQQLIWAAAAVLVGWLWMVVMRHRLAFWRWSGGVLAIVVALVVALPATSIPAYPTTYMHSSVRLDAASVAAGERLYGQYCADCHGVHGLGDGPLAQLNQLRPANLTEPHVSWHTHGDMFWWLSYGKASMPGFAQVLTEQERWHLINHLIALSFGYEARAITDKPLPFKPWLPSIDFRFPLDNNHFMSLSEWRGLHAVHLVIIEQQEELKRAQHLLQDMKGFPAQLVIVVKPGWEKQLFKGQCEAIIVPDHNGEIASAWSNYRRSFASADFLNEERWVPRTEFLIDRYGFVRARWRSDESPAPLSAQALKQIYDSLSEEGEISSAAIHQHD